VIAILLAVYSRTSRYSFFKARALSTVDPCFEVAL